MAEDKIFGSANRRKLYDNLLKDGFDLGTFEDFDRNMNDDNVRKSIHEAAIDAGWELPDYDQFVSDMTVRRMKIGGVSQEVDHATYDDFIKRHPSGSNKKPAAAPTQPKSQPKPTQAPVVSATPAPENKSSVVPLLGTTLGVPYRPDEQMTAAARDEAYRQNDFAVKQLQKIRRENARRNQPVVDTGNPDINNSVIKTQGQWEDELQKGASRISSSVVVPAIDKAIADFDKKAHEVFEGTKEEGNAYGGLPTGTASGATIFGNIKESNKANDPDKVLEYLKGQFEDLYKDKSFVEEVGKEADKMGMDRTDYLEKVIKPQIESDLQTKFDSAMIDKYLPKSGKEYVVNGLSNSIIGMLADAFLETKGQRNYKNQAAAMTEEGDNPYYTPGTGAKLAQMGVSFAADAPFFGVYGKVSGQVAKTIAEREIQKLIGKGLSEGAARSIVGSALENSVGARMKNYIMQHVVGGALTMGGYNATSETARQIRDKEGIDLGQIAGSTAEGLAVGSAFGLTGGVSQALSQPLTGISKIGAKVAGFGAEAETMYATEELSKLVHGEDAFTNPFEGSVEALEKLGVMKLSGGHLFESGAKKLMRAKEVGAKQAIGESLAELLGSAKTGVKFTEDEQSYIRNSQEGKDLVESLANMHPDRAIEEVNGKKKFTKEGEQQRQQLAENYDRFMNNPDIPAGVKEKIAKMFGGIYRTGLETGVTITQNEDGSVILKTRDQDGNCVRDLKFDNLDDAEQWRDQFKSQMSRNDAVNMFNNAPKEVQQNIVNIVRDEVSGKTVIDELKSQAGSMKQKRLKRQLEKISQTAEQYEGREMTDEEARNYIQMVIKDGDDAVFNEMYDLIRENAHPADELNTKRNYWEGQQLSTMERHYAQVEAQLAEERLRLQGDAFAEEIIGAADYPDEKMAELATRSDVTKGQLEAALNYYNKSAKVNGMMDEALKNIDNQVEAANAYVRKNTHTDSGSLIEGNYQGRNYYVTAGHFQISPEGRLVPTDNSGLVILRDKETGDIVTASPNDIQVTGIQDPNRIIEYNESMEGLRGQLIKQADDSIELNPDTPTEAANGDIYTGADGNQYIAIQIEDEAGNPVWAKFAIDEAGNPVGNPMPFDNDEYRKAKSDDIDAAEMPQEEILSPESVQIEQNQVQNAQIDENNAQNKPTSKQEPTPLEQELERRLNGGQAENPQQATPRIPVDEKGRKIYEQAKPEDTLAELTEKYGEEQAHQMISQIAESTTRALEEIKGRDTSKITDMAELEAYQDEVAAAQKKAGYWNGIIRQREAAEAKKQELAKTHIDNMRKAKTLDDLEAAYQAAIKAGVPENELSEVYNAKKAWNNLVNPKEIRNFATDPESQAKWVDEHFDEIVDSYIRTHGNLLDPDEMRKVFAGIGYDGKNVYAFRDQEKRVVRATYDKMLRDAVANGKTSITLLTGAGGAGKSTATRSMDFSDRGMVYDSAFNSFSSLEKAIKAAKAAGMTDIQVVAVYNDAVTSFKNSVERGLKTGRFLPLEYFVNDAFMENQGKISQLRQTYPEVEIIGFDNSGNKASERPDGGRVSVEEAENWDYTINDAELNELLNILEYGINEGRFTEDQAASIGRRLHDVTRRIRDIRPDTVERVARIGQRIRQEESGDIRPDISRKQSVVRGNTLVSTADGEVQGSPEERPAEGVTGANGQGAPAETRTDGEVRTGSGKSAGSDDDGPEPPAAGAAAGGSGSVQSGQHASAAGGSGAPATRGSGNGPASAESELTPAQKKVYQKAVEANIGRTFTFSYGNGTKSVLKVQRIDHNGNAVLMRQDYDAQGNPIGEAREERYNFATVGEAIVNQTWKKELSTYEKLQKYKYNQFKVGDVSFIDVLTEDEMQQILNAYERGDKQAVGNLTGEFRDRHQKDFILRGRDQRNEKIEKALARSGKGERLRGVRSQYDGFPSASVYLEEESMQPQTIEEYVAEALGDVPKAGNGFLAYTSYDKGGNTIVGLKDETGFGSRGFNGDTKGFNPYLAPNGKGISLKQFAEQVHESLPDGMKQQYSDQDLRNIIHNVLTSAEKPSDIANYILRNRLEQAEATARHQEEEWMDAPDFQKVMNDNSFASRLKQSKESVNTEPTEGQKEAGNYKKGHISFGGYDFTIENPEGSMRRGKDATGREWEQKMNNTYGYILGKFGKDGDHLDMFINDAADLDNWNGTVYVVDQVDPKTGKFDEHKVLYGFDSLAEAKKVYLSNYEKGWKGLGRITGVTKKGFDMWLDSSKRKMKEFADHSIAKEHMVESEHASFDPAMKQLNTRGISINDPELMKQYGLKDVVLSKTGDHVTLNKIVVEKQGEGNGTRFMEDLARLADEKGWTLALTPSGGFGAKSIKRLKDFYKRFGFADNKGRNTDFYTRESMIRRPKETVGANTPERQEQALRDAVVEYLRSKGIEVSTDWKLGQKILDGYNGGGKLSASKKRALDTVVPRDNSPFKATAVSSADGAKVLKDLETLAKKSENLSIRGKNSFIGDVADALGAQMKGSKSKYAKFETDDGTEVIIRLADHNATVSQFDYKGEDNGISIVISRKPNKGITNDGDARLVEVFYPDKALKKAEGNPYAEIVKSISNALHTGDYKDTTGLAEREEVNAEEIKQHKVYHGSGAEFDAFDHSHMGEGEGTHAFGYGTYVTTSPNVAEGYAHKPTYRIEKEKNQFIDASRAYGRALTAVDDAKKSGVAIDEATANAEKAKKEYEEAKRLYEKAKKGYLYDVEIPDDTGSNYIDWENPIDQPTVKRVKDAALSLVTESQKKYLEQVEYPEVDPQIEEDLSIFGPSPKYEPDPERLAREIIDKYLGQLDGKSIRGKDLYNSLSHLFLSERDTSKFLYDLGYVGIKYPAGTIMGGGDGATNYVIFNEGDAKITDRTKFFKTPDGHAYGFTYKGKIYVDPRIATSETPIHEYGHLYCAMKRQTDPEGWNNWKQVMFGDKLVQPIIDKVKRDYPELEGKEDDFAEEIITQFSGKRGSERLREIAEEVAKEKGGIFGKAEAVTAMQRLKSILNRFWEGVANMMGWKYKNANQIADRIMADMLNGVDPTRMAKDTKNSALDNTTDTGKTSNRGKRNDTATPQSTVSGDKDTKNINTLQENEQKSSAEAPKFQKVEDDTHSDKFKNFFGDWEKDPENASKIVNKDGEPMVVYHQTANDFTVFDPRHKGAGTNDYQVPFGIFMKPTARNIGLGGEKQMPLYANIRKPLRVENRQVLSALLKSKVEGYKEALAEYDRIDKEYAKKFDEAEKFDHERNVENWNKWKSGEMTEQEYQDAISDTAENVINQWEEAQNKPISEMKELIDSYFRNSEYDGIWIAKDEGSMGRSTETIIAFEPNQVKSATDNIGDYDPNNPDIRFQRVGNPEPEMTPEERQYWNQWSADMKKWRERYAIPETATGPSEKPAYQRGESALDYAQKLVNWNRERSIWQTAPKLEDYRLKREDKDLLESARENEKRYPDSPSAKMRRVAAEFAQIRHAMSQQKAYDKATVKAVTDFAHEFMKLGFGDNLSRGEIERMLSSVKNATGSTDIKKNIDNIMNILMDNHLRNLENQVVKLSSTKELSKTAQGVEKQGKLELKGQRMIQAFREARQERMSVEDIRNRMAEVAEKMNRNDEEAPMWEQEYEGLSIALQYAENVEASRQEWAGLDQIYKDAVKDYRNSGRSYKAQQELLESIEQAMQENKIERIGMYGDVINRLEGNIAESMQGAKEFVEREKQRIKHIHDIANFDLAGKDMGAMREKGKGKPANFFLQPLGTFEQMLKQFGSRNANGEGYLYDYFMRNWMDATDKAFVNEQIAKEELDAKAREVFGGKVKRWSDLYDISRSLPTMDVEVLDGEEPKTFKLTQGNLLYIYMADKMVDGRMKLRKMGIDEEKVEKIKDFLDPRLVQLGDWLQGEYLPQKRTEYNKVHERMFGAPMAAIDNYFPLKVLGDARYQEQDVNVPDSETLPSTITGNIIKRRKNALPLDILHTDALSLAIEHVEDMERWAAQAEWNKDINTLLSYTTFRNKVKNMDTIYGSGDALWNSFKDAAKMAAGTYNPSAKSGHVDAAISNIAKGVTAAKINFRVYTAFKQLLSAPAFLHDVNLADFVHDAVNPYGSWKWAMENMPVFKKRWKSRQAGDTRLMDDPTDWKLWKNNVVQMATRLGMSPNALVDGVTCAVGARSIYKSRYKKYKDIGASDEVAHKRALQDAEIGYNLTQQSSEGAFVSAIQKDRTVAANMLSVFRNSSMAYTRQWVDAARNLKKRAQKGYKEDSIKFMTRQMQDQFGIDEDQAKRAAELEYAREGRRDVARMLNMMFGVTVAWNLGASLPYLLLGDDDNTKKEMLTDALMKGLLAGPTEGLAAGNIFSDFMSQASNESVRKAFKEEGLWGGSKQAFSNMGEQDINPLPLFADIDRMIGKMKTDSFAAAQEVFNIGMQSAVGVNPQTFTDMWNAAMDYGAPGWDGRSYYPDDENLTRPKELALFMMRLMNAPTSSWRNKYIDELGMNAEDAQKLPYEEMARRYAHYKHWKDAPIMGWLRGDEERAEKIDKIQKQFDDAVVERMERLTDEELKHNVMRSESAEEKRKYAKIIAQRLGLEPGNDSKKPKDNEWYYKAYQERMLYEDIREDETLADKYKNLENTFKEKREEAERKSVQDLKEFNEANKEWKNRLDEAKKEAGKRIDWIRSGKWSTPSGKKGSSKEAELLVPGKKQLNRDPDNKENEAIMKNIRKWRKEALEILLRAEAE